MFSQLAGKASFVNYLPRLTQATADDGEPTSGYLLDEITKITFQSTSSSNQLVDYLIHRLNKSTTPVKIKVLKIIIYVIGTGHVSFRQQLRLNDGSIKNAVLHSGPADPLMGNTQYKDVQKLAQDTLELLFNSEAMKEEENGANGLETGEPSPVFMGGMGSTARGGGKYEGFGNSIKEREGTVANKMLDYFGRLIHPTDEQTSEVIRAALHSSPGDYQPVAVAGTLVDPVFTAPIPTTKAPFIKNHVPGKAGGGWESDEDEHEEELRSQTLPDYSSEVAAVSMHLDASNSFQDLNENSQVDDSHFIVLKEITQFSKRAGLPSIDELDEICAKCTTAGYLQLVSTIPKVYSDLQKSSLTDGTLRILLLWEWLYHHDYTIQQGLAKDVQEMLAEIEKDSNLPAACKSKAKKLSIMYSKNETLGNSSTTSQITS